MDSEGKKKDYSRNTVHHVSEAEIGLLNTHCSLQYALMNIVHINEYEIQKEILQSPEVPRKPKITVSTSLCCLKPLFTKTCRMEETLAETRKKMQEPPKEIPVKGSVGSREGLDETSIHRNHGILTLS